MTDYLYAPVFTGWPKIPRLNREVVVTEKIDGTNGVVHVDPVTGTITAGSRTRWITPEQDNHGFAAWVRDHEDDLRLLGPGYHYGEWWGGSIQRGYGVPDKRWSLFNTERYDPAALPACVGLVPVLGRARMSTGFIHDVLDLMRLQGSYAAPGYMNPEGIVVYHTAARQAFKVTLENDDAPKELS